MIKYFYQDNCPHCDNVVLPECLEIEQYNVGDLPYRPDNVPVLDLNGVKIVGDAPINAVLNGIKGTWRHCSEDCKCNRD